MQKFNIKVITNKPKKIYGIPSYEGQITIGSFKETFIMPLDTWTLEQYKQQWHEGLERLKNHNNTCLVTSIQNMASGHPSMEIWTLYKEGKTIYFRNGLLIEETVEDMPIKLTDFDLENCYQFFRPRQIIDEDGNKISEWSIPLSEI